MSFIPLPTYGQQNGVASGSGSGSGSGPSSANQSFNGAAVGSSWNVNPNPSIDNGSVVNVQRTGGGGGGEAEDIMMLGRISGVLR